MNDILVQIHSVTRWIVLVVAMIVIVKSLIGWLGNKPYQKLDNILAASCVGFVHLQFLIGLILYFVSEKGAKALELGMGVVMKNSALRKTAIEHPILLLLAVLLFTIGRSKSKKSKVDSFKHKYVALFFGVGLLLMLAGIPWNL